jgi:hypothetical protein
VIVVTEPATPTSVAVRRPMGAGQTSDGTDEGQVRFLGSTDHLGVDPEQVPDRCES